MCICIYVKCISGACCRGHLRMEDQRGADRQGADGLAAHGRLKECKKDKTQMDENENWPEPQLALGMLSLSYFFCVHTGFFSFFSFWPSCSLSLSLWPYFMWHKDNNPTEQIPTDIAAECYLFISFCPSELSRLSKPWSANHVLCLSSPLWQSHNLLFLCVCFLNEAYIKFGATSENLIRVSPT